MRLGERGRFTSAGKHSTPGASGSRWASIQDRQQPIHPRRPDMRMRSTPFGRATHSWFWRLRTWNPIGSLSVSEDEGSIYSRVSCWLGVGNTDSGCLSFLLKSALAARARRNAVHPRACCMFA